MLPIHNGTFDLSLHAWSDPFERISALAAERRLPLATPEIGLRLDLRAPEHGDAWWQRVRAAELAMENGAANDAQRRATGGDGVPGLGTR